MTGGNQRIYFDHNASAPLRAEAQRAMTHAMAVDANPSSVHADGRASRRMIENARKQVAALFGDGVKQVVFTSGATEAASLALVPQWTMGRTPLRFSRLYVAASAHPCLLCGGRFSGEDVVTIPVIASGRIDLAALERLLEGHDHTTGLPLVAVTAACNETGVVQPLPQIGPIVRAHGGTLIVDAVQMAGRIAMDAASMAGDYFIVSAHKLGGPRGVGAFVAMSDLMMPSPLVRGGGHERGHRAGTENSIGIAGFGGAAEAAMADVANERWDAVRQRRDEFEKALRALRPDVIIHGETVLRLPNTCFFSIPGFKAETTQIALDLDGLSVSAGSACSSGKVGPSHVLKAMGIEGDDGAIRVSFGIETGDTDIQRLLTALERLVTRGGSSRAA